MVLKIFFTIYPEELYFFDAQKYCSEYIVIKNKFDEKFILFTDDDVISKEMYLKEEFDLNKLIKTLKSHGEDILKTNSFKNASKPLSNLLRKLVQTLEANFQC